MTVRTTTLGGTDWGEENILYPDLNDTIERLGQDTGQLGEVRMFALSLSGAVTKSSLQALGWAVCDGTTPSSQGISSATITSTPNLVDKFIRGDSSASGDTGGSDTHTHQIYLKAGDKIATGTSSYHAVEKVGNFDFSSTTTGNSDYEYTTSTSTLPSYYELVFFIKVKVV